MADSGLSLNDGSGKSNSEEKIVKHFSAEEVSKRNFEIKRKLALEGLEMREHQYYLGQQNKVVSLDAAALDFSDTLYNGETYADKFRRNYLANKVEIFDACNRHCGENTCKGVGKCDLPMSYVHALLRD